MGECRALIIPCTGMGMQLSCITWKHKTKPVFTQEGPDSPEKVDRVQVPTAHPGEKSSLSYSLTFVTPESHSLNTKILLTGWGKLKHLPPKALRMIES